LDWIDARHWYNWKDDEGGRVRQVPIGVLDSAAMLWGMEPIISEEISISYLGSTKYFMPMVNRYHYTQCSPGDVSGWYREVSFNTGTGEYNYGSWQSVTFGEVYNTTADYIQFRLVPGLYSSTTTTTTTTTV
jgi:hypothetical protein